MTIAGLTVRAATQDEIDELVAALAAADLGGDARWAQPAEGEWWLHAEQADGYTVGRLVDGAWRLGRAAFPQLAAWRPERLHELRVFSAGMELVAYRDDGGVRGVWSIADPQPPERPLNWEERDLPLVSRRLRPGRRPGRRDVRGGFSLLRRADGTESVAPVDWPADGELRLRVVEHFEQDEETGGVRVAAVRLAGYVDPAEGTDG